MKYILRIIETDKTMTALAGGKGANLGELCTIEGVQVPDGFCVTTDAYKQITADNPTLNHLVDELAVLKPTEREQIARICDRIRSTITSTPIPGEIAEQITACLSSFEAHDAFAIRSSATAEDLPTASFAGQQDTYLNITGVASILQHISQCWASLFTDRAVIYRMQNGFDHRKVYLAVVVQKMVVPQASGILFTADPVSSNRKIVSIDASFGLGEALVAGIVNADHYKVRNGSIIDKKVAAKKIAVHTQAGGGTHQQAISPEQQNKQTLADDEILRLEQLGRRIEQHFGLPQDIEWCLAHDHFYIVQSRPITTLFPIPEAPDQDNHVYMSVGHQQMMTDAMKPLGLSFYLLLTPAPMRAAGGRLFVDITTHLASTTTRNKMLDSLEASDPLTKDALITIIERGDFIKLEPEDEQNAGNAPKFTSPAGFRTQIENDPAIVTKLISNTQSSLAVLQQAIQSKSGPALFDFIREDLQEMKKTVFDPLGLKVILAAMDAYSWINEKMKAWLDDKDAADTLTQSVPNNITSEMGLALLDVADAIRPYPAIIEYLQHTKNGEFLDELLPFEGGPRVREALLDWLNKYGMRCAGEIDITRTRWSEKPSMLIPAILNNIRNQEPHAGLRLFEQGRREALEKEQELLARLKQLPDGEAKADETQRMINIVRNFIGYREYPKYSKVSRYLIYKKALLKEAEKLVQANIIHDNEDIYYLSFDELSEVVGSNRLDYRLIDQRKEAQRHYEKLSPPRVITSDGEIISGQYKRATLPAHAIAGLPVSSGTIEGRARVILNMEEADLEEGDILITAFTDPSWTPLFVSIKGLVTEVGGLMTHGAVIAREYGLPAVVGVDGATKLIKDKQRIRVNGTDGYIEIL